MKIAPKRNGRFIVAFLGIILTNSVHAQKLLSGSTSTLQFSVAGTSLTMGEPRSDFSDFLYKAVSAFAISANNQGDFHGWRPISADYYQKNTGIMCKVEWSFEKNFHVPLRFRLGSLDYVNHLEGK